MALASHLVATEEAMGEAVDFILWCKCKWSNYCSSKGEKHAEVLDEELV